MSENNGFHGGYVLAAFIGGAATGAVIALLTAPQSGAKTRADIRNRAQMGLDEASRVPRALSGAAGAARDAFNDSLSSVKDHMNA